MRGIRISGWGIAVPDKAEARDDIDAAEKLVAKPSDRRLEIGSLYDHVDAFDQAWLAQRIAGRG